MICQSWWYTLVIPGLRRLRQEDGKFRVRKEDKKEEAVISSRGGVAAGLLSGKL